MPTQNHIDSDRTTAVYLVSTMTLDFQPLRAIWSFRDQKWYSYTAPHKEIEVERVFNKVELAPSSFYKERTEIWKDLKDYEHLIRHGR